MKLSMRRLLAASTAAALATTGTLAMTTSVDAAPGTTSTASASKVAAKKATKKAKNKKNKKKAKKVYALGGDAYGTQIKGGTLGVSSGRTAHSYMYCNTQTKTRSTSLLGGALVPDKTFLDLGVVKTTVKARKGAKAARKEGFPKGTRAGAVSTSAVADIRLAGIGDVYLGIKALETEARAWVDKNGKFKTAERYDGAKIDLHTGTPLDDILDGLPIADLIDLLLDSLVKDVVVNGIVNGVLTIAGLGEIKLDKQLSKIGKKKARSAAKALEVRLYGGDGAANTSDDIVVIVGGTSARIKRGAEAGLFGGGAYGLKADLLDGILTTAKIADRPMNCIGTGGKWLHTNAVGVDLLKTGLVKVDGVKTSVRTTGKNKKKKRTATARSQTARVQVGPADTGLVIEAVRSEVKVARKPKAKPGRKLTRKFNVDLGDIYLGGQQIDLDQLLNPVLGGVDQLLETIGIASVKTNVQRKTKNGAGLTAIQIKLLDGSLADIQVGDVEARIRR